jgi:predicted MFS family arabinose efflux permease
MHIPAIARAGSAQKDWRIEVLLVVMVKKVWGAGAAELGWLMSAQGVGALAGAALISYVAARLSPRTLLVFSGIVLAALLFVMVNQPSVYLAMGLIVVVGVLVVGLEVGWQTMMQLGSDDGNRGRVAALFGTVIAASMMVSIIITSALADTVGAVVRLDVTAASMFLGGVLAILAPATLPAPRPGAARA